MKRAQDEWNHDIVNDPKRSQGHKSSVTYSMNQNVTVIKKKNKKRKIEKKNKKKNLKKKFKKNFKKN